MLVMALLACHGRTSTPPPPTGRVLEGPLLGSGLATAGATLWVSAPGVEGDGGAYRFDAPAGALGLADADAGVVAEGPTAIGASLAACADADGDGLGDLVVGAPDEGRNGGAWLLGGPVGEAVLGDGQPFLAGIDDAGHAGTTVACGDTDGDGVAELAVAAPDTEGLGQSYDVGTIGLYRADGAGGVPRIATFESTWSDSHLGFRTGLAMGEDLDGDGIGDLVVAAWGADKIHVVPGPLQGTYDANSAGPMLLGEDGEGTGHSLAVGDVDGDGANDLLIGAPLYAADTGAAWVVPGPFDEASEGLLRNRASRLYGVRSGDQAGFSVAIPGDVDGDGAEDLLIGAPYAGGIGPEAGAAYLVLGPGEEEDLDLATALLLGDVARGRLGWAVAGLDSPEGPLLVVSAPEADVDGVIGAGSVFAWPGTVRNVNYPAYGVLRISP